MEERAHSTRMRAATTCAVAMLAHATVRADAGIADTSTRAPEISQIQNIIRWNMECLSYGVLEGLALVQPWVTTSAVLAMIVWAGGMAFGGKSEFNLSRVVQIAMCVLIADSAIAITSYMIDIDGSTTMAAVGVDGLFDEWGGQICTPWMH